MLPSPPWPARSAICLDCRTVLPSGTACPHGKHRTASLRDPDGREALLCQVWGPRSLRARVREASRVGGIGGGGASLLNGCPGCDVLDAADCHVLLVLVLAFFAIFALWLAGRWIFDAVRRWRFQRALHARGAQRDLPAAPPTGCIGTVLGRGPLLAAPIDERLCVAFGLAITHHDGSLRRGPQTMLRDGATLGFEIELDSGACARIPAGPCTLDLTAARPARPSPRLDRYLRTIDPQHGQVDDLEPFPCDHVDVTTLAPGDRVELLSPIASIADSSLAPVTYREAATIVVPVGPVRLRPLPAASPAVGRSSSGWPGELGHL
jgi:hypothetical protein